MTLLLDTNVVSEAVAARPNERVMAWLSAQAPEAIHLSVVTLAEIAEGIARLPASRRRRQLEAWCDTLAASVGERLLGVDAATAYAWGALRARSAAAKRTIGPMDAFFAATAEVHGLTLVTRNVRHFAAWGGPLLNPWQEAS